MLKIPPFLAVLITLTGLTFTIANVKSPEETEQFLSFFSLTELIVSFFFTLVFLGFWILVFSATSHEKSNRSLIINGAIIHLTIIAFVLYLFEFRLWVSLACLQVALTITVFNLFFRKIYFVRHNNDFERKKARIVFFIILLLVINYLPAFLVEFFGYQVSLVKKDLPNNPSSEAQSDFIWNGDWASKEYRKDIYRDGVIQFSEVGDSVFGTYVNPLGEINRLYGKKMESDSMIVGYWTNLEKKSNGMFDFEMQEDGSFKGTYTLNNDSTNGNIWTGKREGNFKIIESRIQEILRKKEIRLQEQERAKPESPKNPETIKESPEKETREEKIKRLSKEYEYKIG